MYSSYGVGTSWVDPSGLHGSGNFAGESALEVGLSLLEIDGSGSSLRKSVPSCKIDSFRKYCECEYSLHHSLTTIDTSGWKFFVVGGCRVHCRKLSRIPGLYPLGTRSPRSSPLWRNRNVSWYCQVSIRGQSHPWLRTTDLGVAQRVQWKGGWLCAK